MARPSGPHCMPESARNTTGPPAGAVRPWPSQMCRATPRAPRAAASSRSRSKASPVPSAAAPALTGRAGVERPRGNVGSLHLKVGQLGGNDLAELPPSCTWQKHNPGPGSSRRGHGCPRDNGFVVGVGVHKKGCCAGRRTPGSSGSRGRAESVWCGGESHAYQSTPGMQGACTSLSNSVKHRPFALLQPGGAERSS